MSKPIRVLLLVGHRMVREGLSLLLNGQKGIEVSAAVERASLAPLTTPAPDIVILDLDDPGIDPEGLSQLRKECPDARFVGVADTDDASLAEQAVTLGITVVYIKTEPSERLIELITQAASWETSSISRQERPNHARALSPEEQQERLLMGQLTPRELEILQELAEGKSTAQVAKDLSISPLTVQSHVKSILAKLGVHSKIEAVTLAFRRGLVTLGSSPSRREERRGEAGGSPRG